MKINLKPARLLAILLLVIFFYSCDAIIEPSISSSAIKAEAPAANYQSSSYNITFWWQPVNNAISYHLQVVTPNFAAPGSLVLDTVIKTYKFTYTLSPGNYQWRVQAQNGSSATAYSSGLNFSVLNGSISQQTLQLTSPANGFVTNQGSTTFVWQSMFGGTSYQFELDTNNFADENSLVANQTITGKQTIFNFLKDQVYQWRVRAKNDTSQSQWSVTYQITYRQNPPGQVTLLSPASATIDPLPVSLQWNAVSGASGYKLYVYKSDSVTLYNSTFPMNLTSTNYSFNLGNSGDKIYWKVSAVDVGGNEGVASATNYFTIQ